MPPLQTIMQSNIDNLLSTVLGRYVLAPTNEVEMWIGDNAGVVYPEPGNMNKINVRNKAKRGTATLVEKVYNGRVQNIPDMPVIVATDPRYPRVKQVVRYGQGYGLFPPYPEVPAGFSKYLALGGSEQLNITGEQILPWLAIPDPNNALGIVIYKYIGFSDNTLVVPQSVTPIAVDLTSYIPSSGTYLVGVYLNGDGSISVSTPSSTSNSQSSFSSSNTATFPPGKQIIAMVRLYQGQTRIRQDPGFSDIIDMRFITSIGGGMNIAAAGNNHDVQINLSGVPYGDDNFIYDPTNRNWLLGALALGGVAPNMSNDDVWLLVQDTSPAYVGVIYYGTLTSTKTTGASLQLVAALGTKTVPLALTDGTSIGRIAFKGFDGVGTATIWNFLRTDAQIRVRAKGNFTSSNHGTEMDFYTTPQGTASEVRSLSILNDGSLDMTDESGNKHKIHNMDNGALAQDAVTLVQTLAMIGSR